MGCQASTEGIGKLKNKKPGGSIKGSELNDCLTTKQIEIVRETWKYVNEDLHGTGMIAFKR